MNTKEQNLVVQKFDRKAYVKNLADGFSYVKKDAIIRIFLLLAVFLNAILVPLNSLQAPLAGDILGGGAEILSILGISITVGMLLGSVTYQWYSVLFRERGFGLRVVWGLLCFILCSRCADRFIQAGFWFVRLPQYLVLFWDIRWHW